MYQAFKNRDFSKCMELMKQSLQKTSNESPPPPRIPGLEYVELVVNSPSLNDVLEYISMNHSVRLVSKDPIHDFLIAMNEDLEEMRLKNARGNQVDLNISYFTILEFKKTSQKITFLNLKFMAKFGRDLPLNWFSFELLGVIHEYLDAAIDVDPLLNLLVAHSALGTTLFLKYRWLHRI
jgi:hypothetical protein